jgi:hypothetical protein
MGDWFCRRYKNFSTQLIRPPASLVSTGGYILPDISNSPPLPLAIKPNGGYILELNDNLFRYMQREGFLL